MTRKKAMLSILGVALALSVALPLRAESRSSGDFLFGFRFVDTSGPGGAYKYKEDINLQGGARLYNFSLAYTPDNGLRRWLDRLDFRMSNFGGDPFESLEATLQKYGRYALKYARKKAAYFYQDLHRPGGGELYDPRQFGFDRVVDGGSAKISLSKRADLTFSFDRFTRTGNSLTTQDIERVEFVLEKPVQEESKEVALGLNVRLNRYAFFFEERRRDYKNENSLFLPGYADGGPGAIYPTSLHLYILNQPYDLQSFTHTLRFSARPFDNLLLAGRALISREEMDLNYSERAEGLDYLGRKLHYGYSGKGTFDRNVQLYDFDLTYVFTKRFSLVGAVRYHRFDQSGALTGEAGAESADIGYDTLAFDAGLQVLLTARLSLAFGYRNETRNLDGLETATYEFETRQQGFFGNIRWDGRALRLTFDYEHRASEEPYTLMSAANFDRMRLTARYRAGKFNLTGTYLWTDSQGEVFEQDFASTKNQLGLRGGYHGEKIQASAGYSTIFVEHKAARTVTYPPFWTGPGGVFPWEVFHEGKSSLLDASLSVKLKDAWTLGFYGNFYANRGSWEIGRTMLKAYLEVILSPGYAAQAGYRYIDFKEKKSGMNDYRAGILEISFGYRWQ